MSVERKGWQETTLICVAILFSLIVACILAGRFPKAITPWWQIALVCASWCMMNHILHLGIMSLLYPGDAHKADYGGLGYKNVLIGSAVLATYAAIRL